MQTITPNTPCLSRFPRPAASRRAGGGGGSAAQRGGSIARRGGFTLIELLVVIAVIIVMMSILLPVVSKVRTAGNMAKSSSHLRQNGDAFNAFAMENDGLFPVGVDFGNDIFGMKGMDTGWWGWFTYLTAYYYKGKVDGKAVPYDPSIMDRLPPTPENLKRSDYHHYVGYGYNKGLFGNYSAGINSGKRVSEVSNPSRSPLLWTDVNYDKETGYYHRHGGTPTAKGTGGGEYRFSFPYNNKGLILMADGAVIMFEPRGNSRAPDYPEYNWNF